MLADNFPKSTTIEIETRMPGSDSCRAFLSDERFSRFYGENFKSFIFSNMSASGW